MRLKEFLKEEKNVRLLEKIDNELKKSTRSKNDFGFILPILFASLEHLRISGTRFPSFMFQKPKKLKK